MLEAQLTASVSLSGEQQRELNKQKRAVRINNEKYFRYHPELRHMVAAFTEALLEKKPDDVSSFAQEFFGDAELAHRLGYSGWTRPATPRPATPEDDEAVGPSEELVGATGDEAQDMERLLIHMFTEADVDRSGSLDHNEFRNLMLTADLGLEVADINLLLAETDEDQNGNIAYAEFVPLAVEVVQTLRLKAKVQDRVESLKLGDGKLSFNGMTRAEMETALDAAFRAADFDGAGRLSRAQVKQALRAPRLGLTKKQVQMLVLHVDERKSKDGFSLEQMLPLLDILQEATMAEAQRSDMGKVGEVLKSAFGALGGQAGKVSAAQIKTVLMDTYPTVSLLQINAVLTAVEYDAEGLVRWSEWLPTMAMMVRGMIDPRTLEERQRVAQRANFEPVELMDGRDAEMLHQMLMSLFQEHDADGNGTLDQKEFEECLGSTSLGFTRADVQMLMQMADTDHSGKVTYAQFTTLAYDVLLHVARERAISAAQEAEAAAKMQAISRGNAVRKAK